MTQSFEIAKFAGLSKSRSLAVILTEVFKPG